MKKLIFSFALFIICTLTAMAQTTYPGVYYDQGDKMYHQTADPALGYHLYPTISDHFEVYYSDLGFGSTPPNKLSTSNILYVDVEDLLKKAESFYHEYVYTLGFTDPEKTQLKKYRMGIFLVGTDGWVATGSGNNDYTGALWISPSTCHPVGSTIAHEIGHSFQFQVFCDFGGNSGFRYGNGNGSSFWEMTANWQGVYMYPNEMYSTSMGLYKNTHNYAFHHEWHRYQSYWMHFWWCDRYGMDTVGKIWRGAPFWGADPSEALMAVMGWSVEEMYRDYFNAAMHFVTWDFNNADWKQRGSYWDIGNFNYQYVSLGDEKFQVQYVSCPQATGYNVIPLEVPGSGTTVTTHFTALNPGCPLPEGDSKQFWNGAAFQGIDRTTYNTFTGAEKRGFRLGYVALLKDGQRVYGAEDKIYGKGKGEVTEDVTFTIPANTDRLWLVVSPAPSSHFVHLWNENPNDDDQWPYQVQFEGTTILGASNYYLYSEKDNLFFSKGGSGGKQATADCFGLPIALGRNGEYRTLSMLDNNKQYIGGTTTVSTGNSAIVRYVAEETADGIRFMNNSSKKYLAIKNGVVMGNATQEEATLWRLLTPSQRNKMLDATQREAEQGIASSGGLEIGDRSLADFTNLYCKTTSYTSKVKGAALSNSTSGWTLTGSGTGYSDNTMEVYNGTGTKLTQTVTGLKQGVYRVTLSAFYRIGSPGNCVNYHTKGFSRMTNTYVEANGNAGLVAAWADERAGDNNPGGLPAAYQLFVDGRYSNEVFCYVASDGKLQLTIHQPIQTDGGWFAFRNLRLDRIEMDESSLKSFVVSEDTPEPAERSLTNGQSYYLRNKASGTYLYAGNAFGTQASLGNEGLDVKFTHVAEGRYKLNTSIGEGTATYLSKPTAAGDPIYVDQGAFNYAVWPLDNGCYAISYLGESDLYGKRHFFLGYDSANPKVLATNLQDASQPEAQWEILTRANLLADMKEKAAAATPDSPLEMTPLLYASNFGRADARNSSKWRGTPTLGGSEENQCAEKFNCSYDVYQSLTGMPEGDYRIEAQGFYRYGSYTAAYEAWKAGTEKLEALFYANSISTPLPSIVSEAKSKGFPTSGAGKWATAATGYKVPDDMLAASTAFSAGFYKVSVETKVASDGKLRIGFKKTTSNVPDGNWSIFDNVRIFYLGNPDVTGIETPVANDGEAGSRQSTDAIFDLSGRRVSRASHGVYIRNGKKIIVK